MSDGSRVEELLEDRPDLESPLADVLSVDDTLDTWTFDDVPVDSGVFGELVSRGVVEKVGDEYRLADPGSVRSGLEGERTGASPAVEDASSAVEDSTRVENVTDVKLPTVTPEVRVVAVVAAVLAVVVLARSFHFESVFRGGDVVFLGNDPFDFAMTVQQYVASDAFGNLSEVPNEVNTPLLIATLSLLAGILGDAGTAEVVAALYPVVATVITAALLYAFAVRVTADRRVGAASVVMLAVTPGHALRTALGFADHHAFDYLWLGLTALSLVVLLMAPTGRRRPDRETALAVIGLGVGVGFQVLAWDKGPLLVVPIGLVVAFRILLDVRDGRSPLWRNLPVVAGLVVGSAVALAAHLSVGWQSLLVASTPLVLCLGVGLFVAAGETAHRLDLSARTLFVLQGVVSLGFAVAVSVLLPDLWQRLMEGSELLTTAGEFAVAEARPLLSGDSLGFLLLFGFLLFIGLPVLALATWWSVRGDVTWLVACTYAWYFFLLSLFQVRFVGELAPFLAVFSGLGFVYLASRVDLARRPAPVAGSDASFTDWVPDSPDVSTVAALLVLFVLVGGLATLQTGIKIQQTAVDDESYEAAAWMAEYADERGWETREQSYVLSQWGKNRMYNYLVNGDASSYTYARINYSPFLGATTAANATLSDRVRFIVTTDREADPRRVQTRLHRHYGSRNDDVPGLGRFRAVFETESGSPKVFLHVPGAELTGTTSPNATATLSTDVDIHGGSFTYERLVRADASGNFSIRVAYPGTYELTSDGQRWTVSVNETAVMDGMRTDAGS